jgi:hypothetical protein
LVFRDQDAVEVIGHDDERIDPPSGLMHWDFVPTPFDERAQIVQSHLAIRYVPEERAPIEGADGDEVGTG